MTFTVVLITYALGSCRVYLHLLMHLSPAYQVPTVCKGPNQAINLDNKAHKGLFLLFISKVKFSLQYFYCRLPGVQPSGVHDDSVLLRKRERRKVKFLVFIICYSLYIHDFIESFH